MAGKDFWEIAPLLSPLPSLFQGLDPPLLWIKRIEKWWPSQKLNLWNYVVGWHVQKEQDEACSLTKDQIRPKIGLVRRRTHPYLTKHFRVDLKTVQCHKEASLCKLFESWPLWGSGTWHSVQCIGDLGHNSTRALVIEIDCLLGGVEKAYRTGVGLGTMGAKNACKWAYVNLHNWV